MILYEIISPEKTLPFVYRMDARNYLRDRELPFNMICERLSKTGDFCRDGNKIYRIRYDGTFEKVGCYYPDDKNYLK